MTAKLPHWDNWSDIGRELLFWAADAGADRRRAAYLWCDGGEHPAEQHGLWVGSADELQADPDWTPIWSAVWGWRRATVDELEQLVDAQFGDLDRADWEECWLDSRAAAHSASPRWAHVGPGTRRVLAGGEVSAEYLSELLAAVLAEQFTCPDCDRSEWIDRQSNGACPECDAAASQQAVS